MTPGLPPGRVLSRSCDGKALRGAGNGVALVNFRPLRFQGLGVQPGAGDGFPGDLIVGRLHLLHAPGFQLRLDFRLDGLRLLLQRVHLPAAAPEPGQLLVHLQVVHSVLPCVRFARDYEGRGTLMTAF